MLQKFFDLSSVWSLLGWIILTNVILVGYVMLSGMRNSFTWNVFCAFIGRHIRKKTVPEPDYRGHQGVTGWTGMSGVYVPNDNPNTLAPKQVSIISTPRPITPPNPTGPTPLRYGPHPPSLMEGMTFGRPRETEEFNQSPSFMESMQSIRRPTEAYRVYVDRTAPMMSPPDPVSSSIVNLSDSSSIVNPSDLMQRMGIIASKRKEDFKKVHKDRYSILKNKPDVS